MLWIAIPFALLTLSVIAWIWREAINQKRIKEVREQRARELTRLFIDTVLIENATERTGIVPKTPQEAIRLLIEHHESERV